jgi:3-keto-5-aminohexanoate cleavage enzyme
MDGGVRVGLEDNIYYDQRRRKLASNADLLRRVHLIAEANERPLMTSAKLRRLLHLEPGGGRYGRRRLEESPAEASQALYTMDTQIQGE